MRDPSLRLSGLLLGFALGLTSLTVVMPVRAAAVATGDPVLSIGWAGGSSGGLAVEFTPAGTKVQTLADGALSFETAGSTFDESSNFYLTDFSAKTIHKFGPTGALIGPFGSGYANSPESILEDKSGHFYVGEASFAAGDCMSGSVGTIVKLSSLGTTLTTYSVACESRGADWIDLAADQHTMYYTSEGTHVKRFDLTAGTQLTDFNSTALPGFAAYALRILGDGSVLVADSAEIVHLDSSGTAVKTYALTCPKFGVGCGLLFALNLDPDGTSFWTADQGTGDVFKIDIATGAVLESWNADPVGNGGMDVAGLAVKGQITVGGPSAQIPDVSAPVMLIPVGCAAALGVVFLRRGRRGLGPGSTG